LFPPLSTPPTNNQHSLITTGEPQHQLHQPLHLLVRLLRVQVGKGGGQPASSPAAADWLQQRRQVAPPAFPHPPLRAHAARVALRRRCGARPTCCRWMRWRAGRRRPGSAAPPRSACRCAARGLPRVAGDPCGWGTCNGQHPGRRPPAAPAPIPRPPTHNIHTRCPGRHPPRLHRRHLPAPAGDSQERGAAHPRARIQVAAAAPVAAPAGRPAQGACRPPSPAPAPACDA
jgi:hypothetical protein